MNHRIPLTALTPEMRVNLAASSCYNLFFCSTLIMEADSADTDATGQAQQDMSAREKKTAESVQHSEAMSAHGFDGETTSNTGSAQQGGYGSIEGTVEPSDPAKQRREQGYGRGRESRVGA